MPPKRAIPPAKKTAVVKLEASNPADVERAIETCLERFGRLDHVVTAAAIFEDHPFETMTDAQWHRTIAAISTACSMPADAPLPAMADGGAIVNLASEAAHTGGSPMHAHYGATKAGVLAFTKTIARELAPRIRVNAVSPGTIDTPMVSQWLQRPAGLCGHDPDAPAGAAEGRGPRQSPFSAAMPPATSRGPRSM